MAEAREKLRLECLRGRILGIGPDDFQERVDGGSTLKPENGAKAGRHTWKKSWRRTTGKNSRGRVKVSLKMFQTNTVLLTEIAQGMAEMFERPTRADWITEGSDSNWTCHSQDLSNASTVSADISEASFEEEPAVSRGQICSPSQDDHKTETDTETDGEETDNESIASNAELAVDWAAVSPIENIDSPDLNVGHSHHMSGYEASSEEPPRESTYQSRIRSQPDAYSPIRGLPTEWLSEGSREGTATPLGLNPYEEWLKPPTDPTHTGDEMAQMKSKNGSMIIVKRNQLEQLAFLSLFLTWNYSSPTRLQIGEANERDGEHD